MINILWFFLPGIIALGIITSYEDIKEGKIRNKWVIAALAYAAVVYAGFITYLTMHGGISTQYFLELGTNFVFAIAIAFGFWILEIWTAGDGKLFIAFAALIPISSYSLGYQKWIPSITLLVNIFVISMLVMILVLIYNVWRFGFNGIKFDNLKKIVSFSNILNFAVRLFAVFWVIQLILSWVGLANSYLLRLVLTMAAFGAFSKKKAKMMYASAIVSALRFFVDKSVYTKAFWIDFLVIIIVWKLIMAFFRGGIYSIGKDIFTKEVKIKDIKPGMVMVEMVQKITKIQAKEMKRCSSCELIKHKGSYYAKTPKKIYYFQNFLGDEAEGLTEEQVKKLASTGIKKMKVAQTIPFAPFVFIGVIITILSNGNVLIVVRNLFS